MIGLGTERRSYSLGPPAALTLVSVLIVALSVFCLPLAGMFPDFICYWSAADILASGHSPYDAELQTAVQRGYGWNKESKGFGLYDFLPYYYPPWFGLAFVPLLPLRFAGAKLLWFFLNVEMTLLSGYVLRPAAPSSGVTPVLLAALSLFTLACVLLGQTAILVLFLAALSWRLLETGRERSAGVALAWLTIKPQLTAVLLFAVLLRLTRQGRWKAVGSFFITWTALVLASTLAGSVPAGGGCCGHRQTPLLRNTTWWTSGTRGISCLKAVGLRGWLPGALYAVVALPFLYAVVRAALRRASFCFADRMALACWPRFS